EGRLLPWVAGLVAGLLVAVTAPDTSFWLPAAVAVGALAHLVGDLLTTDGIPFPTWPLTIKPPRRLASLLWQRSGDVAVPGLGDAGSAREWLLCTVLTGYAVLTTAATLAMAPEVLVLFGPGVLGRLPGAAPAAGTASTFLQNPPLPSR